MKKLLDWLDHRTGYKEILHDALYERVPGGARWRYVWGSTLVFTFVLQMITGIFLWTAYSPSAQTAWESVYYIQEVMLLGNIVRGIHHYAAQAMVVLLAIHLIQVIIDGAYRAPREVNFWLGLILLQIVLALSLTGYLLPWDQKGYYATQVSTKIMGATPIVGPQLQKVVQGGTAYGHHTVTRFFAMHAGILPGLLIAFLVLHIWVFRRHGIHTPDPKRAPDTTFWPDQVLKDAVACLGVLAVVLLLAIFKGADLSAPADPAESYSAARPEWYFMFLFQFLRFEWVEDLGIVFGAFIVPGVIMLILVLMPLIGKKEAGHKFNVKFTWAIFVGIIALTTYAFWVDSQDEGHNTAVANADRDAERVKELAHRPSMIPARGAVTLLQNDPFTQGPRLFARHCASCHRYDGHDGTGRLVMEMKKTTKGGEAENVVTLPTAPDLYNVGSRAWIRSVLTDYGNHIRQMKNSADKNFVKIMFDPDDYGMFDWWSKNRKIVNDPGNKKSLAALVEFLVDQGGRSDLKKTDETLAKQGREIYRTGKFAVGTLEEGYRCFDCHQIHPRGEKKPLEGTSIGPTLSGYGGRKWISNMIRNPLHKDYYGSKFEQQIGMPAFKNRLSKKELRQLVRWMLKDYDETKIEPRASQRKTLEKAIQARVGKTGTRKTAKSKTGTRKTEKSTSNKTKSKSTPPSNDNG